LYSDDIKQLNVKDDRYNYVNIVNLKTV